ncbi:hypothetical protein HPB49_003336 [Dermacentor silvarum]|uniref:Uncharacterized protein n=1 Tax=Dermacentor silvarum TaxID=543639 RepID=A0ACB8C1I9_DERSI|nr:hypothetical protein HPB49_003336 [Dermacentor silvarum]
MYPTTSVCTVLNSAATSTDRANNYAACACRWVIELTSVPCPTNPVARRVVSPTHRRNMSAHLNAFTVTPLIPLLTLAVHRVNYRHTTSRTCSVSTTNARNSVPRPDQHRASLGRRTTQQGAQQNPTQSAKTPGSSAENPWTRGRSRTRGSPGDRLQTDRSRSAGGSKGRTPSHGRSRDRGHNKKGSDKKEQANLTVVQTQKMDVLLRKAVKAALGLPPHASTERILKLGIHNTVGELIEAHRNGQL